SDDEFALITFSGSQIRGESESVRIVDDDADAGLSISSFPSSLNEGSSQTFRVRLNRKPSANRTVNVSSSNPDVTVSPSSLVFTPWNWNSGSQSVTLTSAHDADSDEGFALIALSGNQIRGESQSVRIVDDDADAGLSISSFPSSLNEGSSKIFSVRLSRKPGANRTVNVSSGNSDVTVSPSSLVFTPLNWNISQTVTLTAAQDDDRDDELALIALSGNQIRGESESIRIVDDDADAGLSISSFPSSLNEGSSKTFSVRLSGKPGASGTVNMSSSNPDVTVSPSSLTFTSSNSSRDQSVTLRAAQDADREDELAVIAFSGDQISSASRLIEVYESSIRVNLSKSSLVLDEGESGTFTVQLAAQPGNARKVTLAVTGNDDVTVSPDSLDFTASNWNTAQTVTVRAGRDADKADDTAAIYLMGDGIAAGSVSVTVHDDDIGLTLSDLDDLTEGGSKTFTVKLAAQPRKARTVTLAVTGDADVTVSPASLDFTTTDWSAAQIVTVSAAQDADKVDDTAAISLTGEGITSGSVSVNVEDDEDAAVGLVLSDLDNLTEGGSKTFTVQLAAQPGNDRKVTLAITGDADVTIDKASLDFTTTDWDTAQTVTVSAADDTDKADDTATINLTGDGITTGSVSVTVFDDEDP
ncbi:MAG: hypothetical protein ISN29_03535, partial [Gammaproteobacteria bacterium AqS3]|nr:hypothetical protein [Gammaproteobacteria bacterium AqS3]